MSKREIHVYPDPAALARAAADRFVILAAEATAARGRFTVALSGGSTPRAMYQALASAAYAPHVEWARVYVFWGDERSVPPNHADSNYRMARETLLDRVPIPAGNVYRMLGEVKALEAAQEYTSDLRPFAHGNTPPRLDLILLGMGDDGHTASLFPRAAAIHETVRWVAGEYVEKLHTWRITLTPVVLNAAANVMFLVAGAGKAARLREVLYGSYQPGVLPAQVVQPTRGRVLWMVDQAAAAFVSA